MYVCVCMYMNMKGLFAILDSFSFLYIFVNSLRIFFSFILIFHIFTFEKKNF